MKIIQSPKIWLGLLLVSSLSTGVLGGIQSEAETVIRQTFKQASHWEFQTLPLDSNARTKAGFRARQHFNLDKLYLWWIYDSSSVIGYAVLDNVMGKAQPITYLVTFSPDLTVRQVRVLKYREQYGGAIQNQTWLSQFSGYTASQLLHLGHNVDGISGATISADALTRGVVRITAYLNAIDLDRPTGTASR